MLRKGQEAAHGDEATPEEQIKDPFVLEFLGLKDEYSESELEAALIEKLETFLMELGGDFAFVGRQRRLRIVLEPFVGVGDDQADTAEATGLEAAQKRGPARPVLDDIEVEDFPAAVGVDAHGDDHRHVDDAPALAAPLDVGVQPQVGVGAFKGSVAELLNHLVELLGQPGHLALGHSFDAHGLHQAIDAARGHTPDVALHDHLHQPPLGLPSDN